MVSSLDRPLCAATVSDIASHVPIAETSADVKRTGLAAKICLRVQRASTRTARPYLVAQLQHSSC